LLRAKEKEFEIAFYFLFRIFNSITGALLENTILEFLSSGKRRGNWVSILLLNTLVLG
jgi:hypothetical protein